MPDRFGPWKTLWKRQARFSKDGTWDRILEQLLADADAGGLIDWQLSIDSTASRVHQHAANLSREVSLRSCPATRGDVTNYKRQPVEPVDHAIGRSRGGLTTNLHTLVDGHGLPLVVQAGLGRGRC